MADYNIGAITVDLTAFDAQMQYLRTSIEDATAKIQQSFVITTGAYPYPYTSERVVVRAPRRPRKKRVPARPLGGPRQIRLREE